jgi:hypothetical protein
VLLGSKQQRFGTEKPGRDAAEILPAMVPALGFAGSFGARGFVASVYMPLALTFYASMSPPSSFVKRRTARTLLDSSFHSRFTRTRTGLRSWRAR